MSSWIYSAALAVWRCWRLDTYERGEPGVQSQNMQKGLYLVCNGCHRQTDSIETVFWLFSSCATVTLRFTIYHYTIMNSMYICHSHVLLLSARLSPQIWCPRGKGTNSDIIVNSALKGDKQVLQTSAWDIHKSTVTPAILVFTYFDMMC